MTEFNILTGAKVLELGGGAFPKFHPNCDIRMRDAVGKLLLAPDGKQAVDFEADFNKPLPIQSDEWDIVFSMFCLEHVSWRNTRQFLSEVWRILKTGGKFVFIIPDTEAQMKYIQTHPDGWENRDLFKSASITLFGDLDYDANSHKAYFSPKVIMSLLREAGFSDIKVQPFGSIQTDMSVEAVKSDTPCENAVKESGGLIKALMAPGRGGEQTGLPAVIGPVPSDPRQPLSVGGQLNQRISQIETPADPAVEIRKTLPPHETMKEREKLYDHNYFDGGTKVGGYAGMGYADFPCHEITFRHVLERKPQSVLELGCARGYIVKRLQDVGIQAMGLDISKHAWMTRVMENFALQDACQTPWSKPALPLRIAAAIGDPVRWDLCFSIAFWEHIPEELVPAVVKEMARVSKRGLHGIHLCPPHGIETGFDKTICTYRSLEWWKEKMPPGHEVMFKDALEQGVFPQDVLRGDGKVKLNIGSFTTMTHCGWLNLDVVDLTQFSQANGYQFKHLDVRQGLPFNTGVVDLIYSSHFLEHLTYAEGLTFLRECRRTLKPDGAMRLIVPNGALLLRKYHEGTLADFDEVNRGCVEAKTQIGKLHAILHAGGHLATYDAETLCEVLKNAGFVAGEASFRQAGLKHLGIEQILKETMDSLPAISLYVDAIPDVV